MFTKTIFAAGALLSFAAAVPMQQYNKRDYIYETSTIEVITTVDVTTTVWLEAGETAPSHYGHGGHHKSKITSHIKQTVTVPAPSPASASSPPELSPASSYVAPSPSSPAAPTTSTWVAPTSQAPAPSSQAPAPAPSPSSSPSGGSGGAPSGNTYSGDITYYTPGLGSCGVTNSDSDSIVALAHDMMEAEGVANPNDNPLCGKSITISYGGKTAQATIEDTCPGCAHGSLDLTPSLFQVFAPLGTGRVSGVEWWYN